ncbi:MAG: hypothetical protein HGA29_07620 [Syntrophaceae bacterium]|nr:hypothetical protein [Syntrophaceae bacterium]
MITVFYTTIRPAEGQRIDDVIKIAHDLGYKLVPFEGYTESDIGYACHPGIKYHESNENMKRCIEIQDAAVVHLPNGDDWPYIMQFKS